MLLLDDKALLCVLALLGSLTDGDGPSAETVWRGVRAAAAPLRALLGALRGTPLGVGCREGVRGVCAMRGVAPGVGCGESQPPEFWRTSLFRPWMGGTKGRREGVPGRDPTGLDAWLASMRPGVRIAPGVAIRCNTTLVY